MSFKRLASHIPVVGLAITFLFGISSGAEPSATHDPEEILQRIGDKVAEHLSHLPNYACHEVVDRLLTPLNGFRKRDRVELEVAFIGQRELFALPGDTHFQESAISQMVTTGAIGDGLFGGHARAIFRDGAASFHYVGLVMKDKLKTYRFDFQVPLEKSSFSLKHNGVEAIIAYQGSVWADFDTLDLVQIEITADRIPPSLGIRSLSERSEYTTLQIKDSDFLLPVHAEMEISDSSDNLSVNAVNLDRCREFTGESTVTFGQAVTSPSRAQP